MAKGLRLSEKWFQRGLWLIAILFAGFLIGLGSLVVGDLPKTEKPVDAEQFMDQAKLRPVRAGIQENTRNLSDATEAEERAALQAKHAKAATQSERDGFDAWIATRTATQQSSQNPEVLARTKKLEDLRALQRTAEIKVETLQTQINDLRAHGDALRTNERDIEEAGQGGYRKAVNQNELKVFGLRLALTLPLLLLAVYLFLKRRKSQRWPFVWGFIFFALFTFFFELVPYLPSYGGYFRYIVGIALTVWAGNYAIGALRKYLDTQKAAEQRPEEERRKDLGYEMAQIRLSRRICPACERPIDIADPSANFCMHCGLLVFEDCPRCKTRQTSFSHFCRACGLIKYQAPPEERMPPPPLVATGPA